MQAQRAGDAAPPPIVQAPPNPFGNVNLPQDGTLATLPFQSYRSQTMNPLFSDLAVRYPAINETLFKAISENPLAPVNILKLSTNYTSDGEKMKVLKASNTLALDALEEDALVSIHYHLLL